jgi:hypothetical protein
MKRFAEKGVVVRLLAFASVLMAALPSVAQTQPAARAPAGVAAPVPGTERRSGEVAAQGTVVTEPFAQLLRGGSTRIVGVSARVDGRTEIWFLDRNNALVMCRVRVRDQPEASTDVRAGVPARPATVAMGSQCVRF